MSSTETITVIMVRKQRRKTYSNETKEILNTHDEVNVGRL